MLIVQIGKKTGFNFLLMTNIYCTIKNAERVANKLDKLAIDSEIVKRETVSCKSKKLKKTEQINKKEKLKK